MIGQAPSPSVTEKLAARIQSRVGQFLQLKATLLKIQDSGAPTELKDQAAALYQEQQRIEPLVQAAVKQLQQAVTDGWTLDRFTSVSLAAGQMELQMGRVRELERTAGSYAKETPGFSSPARLVPLLLLGGAAAFLLLRRSR